jgi:hypothetical protein
MEAVMEHCLFPSRGLPPTGYPAGEVREWWNPDSLENYRIRGGHSVYGEHDVLYRFNSLGYRGPEFSMEADIRIVAIGCSYVFGLGLAEQHLFHERFAEKLRSGLSHTVIVWNLAVAGASNDYISRMLHQALPLLDPHIVLVNFTHLGRREYVSVENRVLKYLPSYTPTDSLGKMLCRHFEALSSPHDDVLNYYRNYKAVEHALANRCWLYSQPEWVATPAYLDRDHWAGPLCGFDKARDGDHPGPASHRVLAALYWDKFVALGGLETVRRTLQLRHSCASTVDKDRAN